MINCFYFLKKKRARGSIVLMNLERFSVIATALCKHLQMNITTRGGMLLSFHNALNILLLVGSSLVEDEAFLLMN